MNGHAAVVSRWAEFYRQRGWNPLPTRPDAKRPHIKYAELWEADVPVSAAEFDRWGSTALQLMTGRHWGLLVIDLDGPEARDRWAAMGSTPTTWVTHSGGNGHHLWFRVPRDAKPLPKAFLWRGEGKHSAIERLCDRSLIMAPPSIHPETGRTYKFLDDRHSPKRLPMPADVPGWVLALPPIATALVPPPVQPTAPRHRRTIRRGAGRFTRREVIDAIPSIPQLVASWGVRLAGKPSASGWQPCHAVGRDDAHASAAVNVRTGNYTDLGSGVRMSLFDLGVTMGVYLDWRDALNDLGGRYCVATPHVRRSG